LNNCKARLADLNDKEEDALKSDADHLKEELGILKDQLDHAYEKDKPAILDTIEAKE
jgi:hypothetical protein